MQIDAIQANRPGASAQIIEMMKDMLNPLRYSSVKVNGAEQTTKPQAFAQNGVTLPPAMGGAQKFSDQATGQLTGNYDADGNRILPGKTLNVMI